MKPVILVVTMSCVGLFAGGACAQSSASPAQQAIRSQMAKMLVAANAHDTDGFMASMVRTPNLVFAINGEVIRGWQALHAQQLKWWHHGRSAAKYAQRGTPMFTALEPDIEILTWPLRSSHVRPDGKVGTSAFVVTYVWQHLPQGWRIVYGHESWAKPPGR
ncbi:MAG: YybH family protein [Rhodanobacteraceae bacterium]